MLQNYMWDSHELSSPDSWVFKILVLLHYGLSHILKSCSLFNRRKCEHSNRKYKLLILLASHHVAMSFCGNVMV